MVRVRQPPASRKAVTFGTFGVRSPEFLLAAEISTPSPVWFYTPTGKPDANWGVLATANLVPILTVCFAGDVYQAIDIFVGVGYNQGCICPLLPR